MRRNYESGQGLVEYALILILFAVVIIVILSLLSSCAANAANSNSAPTQSPVDSATVVPQVELGQVLRTDSTVSSILAVDSLVLPNCQGSSELAVTRTFSKETTRTIQFNLSGTLGFNIALETLEGAVKVEYGITDTEQLQESINVEVRAAPGTTVTYAVEWIEESSIGLMEIITGNDIIFQQFSVTDSLRANIRQPERTDCPATATPP